MQPKAIMSCASQVTSTAREFRIIGWRDVCRARVIFDIDNAFRNLMIGYDCIRGQPKL